MEEKKELLDQDERAVEIELERLRGFVNYLRKLQIFWEYMTVTCMIFGKMKSWSILQWIL